MNFSEKCQTDSPTYYSPISSHNGYSQISIIKSILGLDPPLGLLMSPRKLLVYMATEQAVLCILHKARFSMLFRCLTMQADTHVDFQKYLIRLGA